MVRVVSDCKERMFPFCLYNKLLNVHIVLKWWKQSCNSYTLQAQWVHQEPYTSLYDSYAANSLKLLLYHDLNHTLYIGILFINTINIVTFKFHQFTNHA